MGVHGVDHPIDAVEAELEALTYSRPDHLGEGCLHSPLPAKLWDHELAPGQARAGNGGLELEGPPLEPRP